jgi:putative addiction module component (TIGR02574 family)
MSTYSEILSAALALPPQERGELAEVLRESIVSADGAFQQELKRRSAEIETGTASYVTWEQMRDRARRAAGFDG